MALLTYEQTRPWAGAKSIKERVVKRTMPPCSSLHDKTIGVQELQERSVAE